MKHIRPYEEAGSGFSPTLLLHPLSCSFYVHNLPCFDLAEVPLVFSTAPAVDKCLRVLPALLYLIEILSSQDSASGSRGISSPVIAGLFRAGLLKVLLDEGVISQQIVDLLLSWNHH